MQIHNSNKHIYMHCTSNVVNQTKGIIVPFRAQIQGLQYVLLRQGRTVLTRNQTFFTDSVRKWLT